MHKLKTKGSWVTYILTYVLMILAACIVVISLKGCTTLGYENVDTTRKTIVVAVAEVRAQNLLLQDLIERRAIGREPATRALNGLQDAKNNLQTALNAIDLAGDPATATNNLARANSLLSVVIDILAPLVEPLGDSP